MRPWFSPVVLACLCVADAGAVAAPACEARSGERITPVIELYTSEGCSSCPPADQWVSGLKGQDVVVQAFHVAYWDYIGWKDRFAQPAFSARQKEIATRNGLQGIYTPQMVRNGQDWPQWRSARQLSDAADQLARVSVVVNRLAGSETFEARVTPRDPGTAWSAYWTVTEDGHNSRVKAGENASEYLQHDFVVRQFQPVGRYQGAQTLRFVSVAADASHTRRINLVVSQAQTGVPLQAVGMVCM